jgi:IS30 family transposase
MRNYKQLNQAQRYQIEIVNNKAGKNQKEIAKLPGVSPATICRDLKRNKGQKGYRPKEAQIKAVRERLQRILRSIFQSFKQGFRIGIVITDRRTTQGWHDAQLLQRCQQGASFIGLPLPE